MTHDELLAKIDDLDKNYYRASMPMQALRAVVELHKSSFPSLDKGEIGCVGCGYNVTYSVWNEAYPCPTVQAIEKELG
jgi:hypothetical protein